MDTNQSMLRNLMTPLVEIAKGLKHVTLLQGTKAYGAHIHLKVPLPARERAPRDDHENFYWLQEDDLRAMAEANGFAWTIFRPQIIVGAAWGAAMNPLIAIAAYAAIRHELGLGLPYPGGAAQVMELVDPRLLGEAFVWAAGAFEAVGETFNVTGNGADGNLSSKNVQFAELLASLSGLSLGTSSNGGLSSNYYPLSTANSAVTITPKTVTLTAPVVSKVYDGNANHTPSARTMLPPICNAAWPRPLSSK